MNFEFFSQKLSMLFLVTQKKLNVLFQLILSIYLDGSVNNTIGSNLIEFFKEKD